MVAKLTIWSILATLGPKCYKMMAFQASSNTPFRFSAFQASFNDPLRGFGAFLVSFNEPLRGFGTFQVSFNDPLRGLTAFQVPFNDPSKGTPARVPSTNPSEVISANQQPLPMGLGLPSFFNNHSEGVGLPFASVWSIWAALGAKLCEMVTKLSI